MLTKFLILPAITMLGLLLIPIIIGVFLLILAIIITFKVLIPWAKKVQRDKAEMYVSYLEHKKMSKDNIFRK